MAVETAIRVAGIWKIVTQPEVRVSGSFKDVTTIETKVAGTWQKVFQIICTAGTSTIPRLNHRVDEPERAFGGARWDPDGGVYYYEGVTTPSTSFPATANGGTWIGNCPASEYEGRWIQTGGISTDEPNKNVEPLEDIWRAMDVGLGINTEWDTGGEDNGALEFQLRRKTDQTVILTDPFDFDIESEDPTPK